MKPNPTPPQQKRSDGDAIRPDGELDREKLKENQRRLNVDEQHKTPEMQKRHRGTFP